MLIDSARTSKTGIENDGWLELGAESWQVLTDSPHLASYVRDFHLDIGVNRLVIVCYHHYKWEEFPVSFRTALVSLLSLPSLRCIALTRYYGVPSSLIRHALVSYKEVSFDWVTIGSDEEVLPSISWGRSPCHLLHPSTISLFTIAPTSPPHSMRMRCSWTLG
ncbi:hypothetical protein B0H13DRAFT_2302097 [Mycena leptocephala]|nr:hypothetical protein B0H13DRAFT_2302097 [Mycena leptocephala]